MNKNILIFTVFAVFNFLNIETTAANIHTHNLTINIQPKDNSDTDLFTVKAQHLFELLQTAHRNQNGSNLYNQILEFIRETQEAIQAGLNLFSTASSSSSVQIIEALQNVATEETPAIPTEAATTDTTTSTVATSEEISDAPKAVTEDTISQTPVEHKTITTKNIEISISISLEKTDDEDLFNALVAKMNALAQALNENSRSAEEITTMFNDVILASQHLPNTNLVIKIN